MDVDEARIGEDDEEKMWEAAVAVAAAAAIAGRDVTVLRTKPADVYFIDIWDAHVFGWFIASETCI